MLGFWDWEGQCKLVNSGGYVTLVSPDVGCSEWAGWWRESTGRLPNITSVYAVSYEFYEEWAEPFRAKGLLCEESAGGEM